MSLPSEFMKADLWVVPAGNRFEGDLLIVDNPVLEEVLGMFPVDLHEQISKIITERREYGHYGLIVSPVWPKGRMAVMEMEDYTAIQIGCTALLWWMLEHPEASVNIALPQVPRWVRGFANLTIYEYEGEKR